MAANREAEARRVGRQLLELGCVQGAAFSAPLSSLSWRLAAGNRPQWEYLADPGPVDRWVIASQDCDIAAPPAKEPWVEALPARWTEDPNQLHQAAKGNSARSFLLGRARDRGLVASALGRIWIEKRSLLVIDFAPVPGPAVLRRFAIWIGTRYHREALPDAVVEAIARPVVQGIERLRAAGDHLAGALDRVEELRLAPPDGSPPWEIAMLARLAAPDALTTEERAELAGWLEEVLGAPSATVRRIQLEFGTAATISLADYLRTVHLGLDHFSLGPEE